MQGADGEKKIGTLEGGGWGALLALVPESDWREDTNCGLGANVIRYSIFDNRDTRVNQSNDSDHGNRLALDDRAFAPRHADQDA